MRLAPAFQAMCGMGVGRSGRGVLGGGGQYLIQPLQCDHSANCVRAMTGVAVLLVVQKVWAVSYPEGLWDAATGMVLA
jgi:hypothetical protein